MASIPGVNAPNLGTDFDTSFGGQATDVEMLDYYHGSTLPGIPTSNLDVDLTKNPSNTASTKEGRGSFHSGSRLFGLGTGQGRQAWITRVCGELVQPTHIPLDF